MLLREICLSIAFVSLRFGIREFYHFNCFYVSTKRFCDALILIVFFFFLSFFPTNVPLLPAFLATSYLPSIYLLWAARRLIRIRSHTHTRKITDFIFQDGVELSNMIHILHIYVSVHLCAKPTVDKIFARQLLFFFHHNFFNAPSIKRNDRSRIDGKFGLNVIKNWNRMCSFDRCVCVFFETRK